MANLYRRDFLAVTLSSLVFPACTRSGSAPAAIVSDAERPKIPYGVQSGDPLDGGMVVWSKTDRPARLIVEWGTDPSLKTVQRVNGPVALAESDYTARVVLPNLPPSRKIYYRVVFETDDAARAPSVPILGSFRSAPGPGDNVRIAWSGDTAGQGFGIDVSRGGMKTYGSIADMTPDLFIHSGDRIYADNPLPPEIKLPDGTVWKNLVTPAKSRGAETLDDYRGNYAYNFLDEHVRRLHTDTATIVQWDDHEVCDNWFPSEVLDNPHYDEKRVSQLAVNARRAMEEYSPSRPGSIHRVMNYGPHADIFVLDARSFRNPNGANREPSAAAGMLGSEQIEWLKAALLKSKATWKIIACDQPLALVLPDGPDAQDGFANGEGPALGREHELAALLTFIKEKRIRNTLWITADVHYAAAHHFDPSRAKYTQFNSFWEFIAGPLHAGTYGPEKLDETFGPEVKFANVQAGEAQNQAPSEGKQSFGVLSIDGPTGRLRVSLHDREGREMWVTEMDA